MHRRYPSKSATEVVRAELQASAVEHMLILMMLLIPQHWLDLCQHSKMHTWVWVCMTIWRKNSRRPAASNFLCGRSWCMEVQLNSMHGRCSKIRILLEQSDSLEMLWVTTSLNMKIKKMTNLALSWENTWSLCELYFFCTYLYYICSVDTMNCISLDKWAHFQCKYLHIIQVKLQKFVKWMWMFLTTSTSVTTGFPYGLMRWNLIYIIRI